MRWSRPVLLALLAASLVTMTLSGLLHGQAAAAEGEVLVTEATGAVTPVMAAHLVDAVAAAEDGGYAALYIRMDTPGGLQTSMREIVQTFLSADVPIVVHVAPPGAGAASAGYIIATAAHTITMAPGTNIGAATPIDMEGGEVLDKVVNDAVSYATAVAEARGRSLEFAEEAVRDGASVRAEEAVERDVADLVAETRDDVFAAVDAIPDGASTVAFEPSWVRRFLQRIADPNLAFLFLSIGTLALLYEVANPGLGAGAAVGVTLIILAMYSLSVLPVNWAGVALIVLALALFTAEIFAPGIGVAAAGGTLALLLGGLFLFQRPTGIGVDWTVLAPTVVLAGLAAVGVAVIAARSRSAPSEMFTDQLVGDHGTVRTTHDGVPQVFVGGSWWRVRAPDTDLRDGDRVVVTRREDLDLIVEPVPEGREDPGR